MVSGQRKLIFSHHINGMVYFSRSHSSGRGQRRPTKSAVMYPIGVTCRVVQNRTLSPISGFGPLG